MIDHGPDPYWDNQLRRRLAWLLRSAYRAAIAGIAIGLTIAAVAAFARGHF